jgi:hypothetical protein
LKLSPAEESRAVKSNEKDKIRKKKKRKKEGISVKGRETPYFVENLSRYRSIDITETIVQRRHFAFFSFLT